MWWSFCSFVKNKRIKADQIIISVNSFLFYKISTYANDTYKFETFTQLGFIFKIKPLVTNIIPHIHLNQLPHIHLDHTSHTHLFIPHTIPHKHFRITTHIHLNHSYKHLWIIPYTSGSHLIFTWITPHRHMFIPHVYTCSYLTYTCSYLTYTWIIPHTAWNKF